MNKLVKWLRESNRWKHIVGGVAIGAFANSAYCAAYAGIGVASALELKDKLWGGKPDLIEFALTIQDVTIGYAIRYLILYGIP